MAEMLDSNMSAMLGAFDFQKLLEMQQRDEDLAVKQQVQQQVAVDTPTATPVVNTASETAPNSGDGNMDMQGMMDLAQLAMAFF